MIKRGYFSAHAKSKGRPWRQGLVSGSQMKGIKERKNQLICLLLAVFQERIFLITQRRATSSDHGNFQSHGCCIWCTVWVYLCLFHLFCGEDELIGSQILLFWHDLRLVGSFRRDSQPKGKQRRKISNIVGVQSSYQSESVKFCKNSLPVF